MQWWVGVLLLVLASGFGFAGGRLALRTDRGRVTAPEPVVAPGAAAFALEHLDGTTWSLVNVGDADARSVQVVPLADGVDEWPPRAAPGQLTTVTSDLLPTLAPGASTSVWLSRYDTGRQVMVSWTSEANVRMGPVALDVPTP